MTACSYFFNLVNKTNPTNALDTLYKDRMILELTECKNVYGKGTNLSFRNDNGNHSQLVFYFSRTKF